MSHLTTVDHAGHSVDGDGCFGDVGGQDDLALRLRAEHAVLLFRRQVTIERQDDGLGLPGDRRQPVASQLDLANSWEEDQQITGG